MIAWDDDVGSASHHVMTSHTIAPTSPARMTLASTTERTTNPLPMVFATAVPNRKTAMKLKAAAQTTAAEGDSTRVEPTLPMECGRARNPLINAQATGLRTIQSTH